MKFAISFISVLFVLCLVSVSCQTSRDGLILDTAVYMSKEYQANTEIAYNMTELAVIQNPDNTLLVGQLNEIKESAMRYELLLKKLQEMITASSVSPEDTARWLGVLDQVLTRLPGSNPPPSQ